MTAPPLVARDALAAALRDLNYPSLAGDEPVAQHWVNQADALLASGILRDPASLADDDELVGAMVQDVHDELPTYRPANEDDVLAGVRTALKSLAATLSAHEARAPEERKR